MKFTKEEISLCKQMAEKYRKPIQQGDWVLDSDNKPWLVSGVELWKSSRPGLENTIAYDLDPIDRTEEAVVVLEEEEIKRYPALWQISDCLEFLRERKRADGEIRLAYIDHHDQYFMHIFEEDASAIKTKIILVESGNTPLEALLKAILEILNVGTT